METATGNFGSGLPASAFPLLAPDGSAVAPSYAFANDPATGLRRRAIAGSLDFVSSGTAYMVMSGDSGPNGLLFKSTVPISWSSGDPSAAGADTSIRRNAAGVIEINNGTAGAFRDLIARQISSQAVAGAVPVVTTTQVQLWGNGAIPTASLINSAHSVNNRAASVEYTAGSFFGRFYSDNFSASATWLTVAGGQAAGITSLLFGGTSATVFGVNGAAGQATRTGFGTPTGTGVIANFPGATATLAQTSQAVAQIILDLKALGFYGA